LRASRAAIVLAVLWTALAPAVDGARQPEPIVYTVSVPQPETHYLEVEARVPTGGRAAVDLMMPIWSPGYYRVEDYAARVSDFVARTPDGVMLSVEKPQANRWRVQTRKQSTIVLSYRVFCNQRSVTTNYVGADMGVLNGAPTFVTLVENRPRPHEIHLVLPAAWKRAMTGMDEAPGRQPDHFRAADYETLVDSPILAGDLVVREFLVAGKKHYVVGAGDVTGWDADAAARDLSRFVDECYRFWGFLPYDKYDFLLMFRQGGGGLEHKTSNLSTMSVGRGGGVGLLSHEYFHLFNVKRLRPVELGPFDFERQPRTGSLWIAEGVTSYYSTLLVERAGLSTVEEYLASLGSTIGELQKAPGRLLQSVEQSSLDVWNNSNSGVGPAATTVSYYVKGQVLGFLLDARIRQATDGRSSFDDVLRLAYRRYSGEHGFTAEAFRRTSEEIAGVDLKEWFRKSVSTAEELDYTDALDWFGIRFVTPDNPAGRWKLAVRDDETPAQQRHLQEWLAADKARKPGVP
jgi:predicted metalloprotease with PDZ domain